MPPSSSADRSPSPSPGLRCRAFSRLAAAAGFACLVSSAAFGAVLINEVDPRSADLDLPFNSEHRSGAVVGDFLELLLTPDANPDEAKLDGVFVILFDGRLVPPKEDENPPNGDENEGERLSYASYDLSGFAFDTTRTGDNAGLFLIGTYGIPKPDVIIHRDNDVVATFDPTKPPLINDPDDPYDDEAFFAYLRNPFEPGVDAIVLSKVAVEVGTPVTEFASAQAESILDAFVYKFSKDTPPAADIFQESLLLPGNLAINENLHSNPELDSMGLSTANFDSLGRSAGNPGVPRSTATHQVGAPTPGTVNRFDAPRLTFELRAGTNANSEFKTDLAEGAADGIVAHVVRSGPTTAALPVTIDNLDSSEIRFTGLTEPTPSGGGTLVIPAGASSATFTINAENDNWRDGDQTAYFTATADGYSPAAGHVRVADQTSDPVVLEITEVHGHVFGDANEDETADSGDQFVEIVNRSTEEIDLEGYVLHTGGKARLTFPRYSILLPGAAAVVFGDIADDKLGTSPDFGTAMVFKAQDGLDIDRHGDVISLTHQGTEVAGRVYWPYLGGSNVAEDTIGHRFALVSNGEPYSPGRKTDGTNYATAAGQLTFTFSAPTVAALHPDGTATVTLSRPGDDLSKDVEIVLSNLNPAVAELAGTSITVPSGQASSAPVALNHNQDLTPSAFARFKILSAPGYYTSSAYNTSAESAFKVVATGEGFAVEPIADTVAKNAGGSASAAILKIGNPLPSGPITVKLTSGAAGVSVGEETVVIPAGVTEYTVALHVADAAAGSVNITAIADPPDSRNARVAINVIDNPLAAGPFVNEFDRDPYETGDPNDGFVELYIPGAEGDTVLDGYSLAVFDEHGAVTAATRPLAGTAVTGGYALIAPIALPESGALAIYRGPPPTSATASGRLDAISWGAFDAGAGRALLPIVTSGNLASEPPLSAALGDGLATFGRTVIPIGVEDFRQPARWGARSFPTPGYANDGAAYSGWEWAANRRLEGGLTIGSPDDDYDGDALTNVIEFALGCDPVVVDQDKAPLWFVHGEDGLSLELAAFSALALADEAHFTALLESSESLATESWVPLDVKPGAGVVDVPLPDPLGNRLFHRLKTTLTLYP